MEAYLYKLNKLIMDKGFTVVSGKRGDKYHLFIQDAAGLYACGWHGDDYYASSKPNMESITLTDRDGLVNDTSIEIAYNRLLLYIEVMECYRSKKID